MSFSKSLQYAMQLYASPVPQVLRDMDTGPGQLVCSQVIDVIMDKPGMDYSIDYIVVDVY